jgi:hypothetical protein
MLIPAVYLVDANGDIVEAIIKAEPTIREFLR